MSSQDDEPLEIDLSFLIPVSPCQDSTSHSVLDDLEKTTIEDPGMSFSHDLHNVMRGDGNESIRQDEEENQPQKNIEEDSHCQPHHRASIPLKSRELSAQTEIVPFVRDNVLDSINFPPIGGSDAMIETGQSETKSTETGPEKRKRTATKSLGAWSYNARKRKRVYVSLTGKKLTGVAAMTQCRRDKNSKGHPSRIARMQLAQAVSDYPYLSMDGNAANDIRETRSRCLSDWGVPSATCKRYADAGVTSLFPWQVDCLLSEGAAPLRGKSLVYTAPTSGGKTLVAELLMLRQLGLQHKMSLPQRGTIEHIHPPQYVAELPHEEAELGGGDAMDSGGADMCNGSVLFVVPFISLAEEKASYLQDMWGDLFIGVRTFHGEDDGATLTDDVDVAVCTIERANVILTQLLDTKEADRLKMIVVDELHLISDSRRGFLLEVLLSKIKYCLGSSVQIVAMSATLPNVTDLSRWLDASLYSTTYRPVNLETRLCFGRKLYKVSDVKGDRDPQASLVLDRDISPLESTSTATATAARKGPFEKSSEISKLSTSDSDGFIALCAESISTGKSLMVFCASKRRCEVCVERITELLESGGIQLSCNLSRGHMITQHEQRSNLVSELKQTPVGACPLLRRTILHGVAYHHAGLTVDERKIVEQGFRTGLITVLCTTTTLSAGVNLPAHRVIVRSPHMGNTDLSVASFRQMCGRAGRMGFDSEGEALLIVPNTGQGRSLGVHLMTSPMDPLLSSLHIGSGGGIEKLLLEMIYCEKISTLEEVKSFVACTLMAVQHPPLEVEKWTLCAADFLINHQFVVKRHEMNPLNLKSVAARNTEEEGQDGKSSDAKFTHVELSDYLLRSSPLGKATSLSGISPRETVAVLASLTQARRRLILQSGFHAVYLVTPPVPSIEPCWNDFERITDNLLSEYPDVRLVLDYLGVNRGDMCSFKTQPPKYGCVKPKTCFYRRLHAAIILFSLIQEMPLNKVCRLVNVQRGQLQQLQKDAAAFCGMASSFCKHLNWTSLSCVLETYSGRLSFGVRPELVALSRLGPEMPGFRARAFYQSGITSPEEILQSNPDLICSILMDCMPYEGKDPLQARDTLQSMKEVAEQEIETAEVVHKKATNLKEGRRHGSGVEDSCKRLALRIINQAKKSVKEEMEATYRQHTFLS